jgi:hypothetical protein
MQWLFTAIGILCLLAAGYLSVMTDSKSRQQPNEPPPTYHPASWGAAEGFAIAGGLCLLAAGLVHRNTESSPPRIPAGGEQDRRATADGVRERFA